MATKVTRGTEHLSYEDMKTELEAVQPREEKALGRPSSSFPVLQCKGL